MNIELPVMRAVDGQEVEISVECEFAYHKAVRGARDSIGGVRGAGPALEPDEPASMEFISAHNIETGEEVELTESELDKATDKAWDSFN
jgi:hypothetical protein